jgi:hypothetical protein
MLYDQRSFSNKFKFKKWISDRNENYSQILDFIDRNQIEFSRRIYIFEHILYILIRLKNLKEDS